LPAAYDLASLDCALGQQPAKLYVESLRNVRFDTLKLGGANLGSVMRYYRILRGLNAHAQLLECLLPF